MCKVCSEECWREQGQGLSGRVCCGGGERGWNKQVIFIPAGNLNPGRYEEYINDANDLIHFECSASHTQLPKTAHTRLHACRLEGIHTMRETLRETLKLREYICTNKLYYFQGSCSHSRLTASPVKVLQNARAFVETFSSQNRPTVTLL